MGCRVCETLLKKSKPLEGKYGRWLSLPENREASALLEGWTKMAPAGETTMSFSALHEELRDSYGFPCNDPSNFIRWYVRFFGRDKYDQARLGVARARRARDAEEIEAISG